MLCNKELEGNKCRCIADAVLYEMWQHWHWKNAHHAPTNFGGSYYCYSFLVLIIFFKKPWLNCSSHNYHGYHRFLISGGNNFFLFNHKCNLCLWGQTVNLFCFSASHLSLHWTAWHASKRCLTDVTVAAQVALVVSHNSVNWTSKKNLWKLHQP